MNYEKKKDIKCAKQKEQYYPKDFETAAMNFFKEGQWGCSFFCTSCHTQKFKRGVKPVTENFLKKVKKNGLINLLDLSERMKHSTGSFYICDNCYLYLNKDELLPLNMENGMNLDNLPEELNLTPLEKQLIGKNLYFLKVRKLPKTQMDVFNDRGINVLINYDDFFKTARVLARLQDNSLVPINLKRKLDTKS